MYTPEEASRKVTSLKFTVRRTFRTMSLTSRHSGTSYTHEHDKERLFNLDKEEEEEDEEDDDDDEEHLHFS